MTRIILTTAPTYKGYSIEAGKHDGIKHFDHHGEFKNQPCPANNNNIHPIMEEDAIIEITHTDTDTLIGVYRLLGLKLPDINLEEVEKIDNNGPSVVDQSNRTLLYMKGINNIYRKRGVNARKDKDMDITGFINKMYLKDDEFYIADGIKRAEEQEEAYKTSLVLRSENIALYLIKARTSIDNGRPYKDGITHFVLFSESTGSISIFRRPELTTIFNNKEWGGILFEGHEGACGSPRGEKYTLENAKNVFLEVCDFVIRDWEDKRYKLEIITEDDLYEGEHLDICPHCKKQYIWSWDDPNFCPRCEKEIAI